MLIFLLICTSFSFYLPGVKPTDYKFGEKIPLFVKKLDSSITQIPYEYYYLNFCPPESITPSAENIGEELVGDKIENSPYEILSNISKTCSQLCETRNSKDQIDNFKWMIDYQYRASWVLDSLPAGFILTSHRTKEHLYIYQDGFPIGFKDGNDYFINNHHSIVIEVYPTTTEEVPSLRIVGFLVEPVSVSNRNNLACENFTENEAYTDVIGSAEIENKRYNTVYRDFYPQILEENITFSYSVVFKQSKTQWASRWEHYFYMSSKNREVHWLGLVNSFAMVLLLTGMVGTILRRAIRRDVNHYNNSIDYEDETGWKQVRSDVFRSPYYSSLFSILIGSGIQVISMMVLTLFFTSLGFLSPEHRGGLLTTVLILYVFMGIFAGYTSARIFKMFGGVTWKRNAFGTAFLFPGVCFSVFFFVNLFLQGEHSSSAVSFTLLLQILLMWVGISIPLVYLGAFIGFNKPPIENPSRVSRIPKPIQITPGLNKIRFVSFLAGCLPFGCMFIELSYVMNSLWHHTLFYYLFGFLFLCFIVLIITSAEVSILMCYILLCREDYRWWWLSFGVAGSSGIYFFIYAVIYWFIKLAVFRFSSIVLYFGYMILGSIAYALITGTIGFFATFVFIRTIFSMIKLE